MSEAQRCVMNSLALLQIVTLGVFIGMLIAICFLIALTTVQIKGVNYAPVKHFEIYQHCKESE